MGIKVNFNGVSDEDIGKGFEVFAITDTICRVSDAEEKILNDGVNWCLLVTLEVAEGEHEGKRAGQDRLMFHTDGLKKRAFFVLRRMGIEDGVLNADGFEVTPELVKGRPVRVTTEIERSCPEQGCFGGTTVVGKDGEETLYSCKKCEWRGTEPWEKSSPTYAGYSLAEGEVGAAASTGAGTQDIPF